MGRIIYIKLILAIIFLFIDQTLLAQSNRVIARSFKPIDEEVKGNYTNTIYHSRGGTINGVMKFRNRKFKYLVFKILHAPHTRITRTRIMKSTGKFVLQGDSIKLVSRGNRNTDSLLIRYGHRPIYHVKGIELTTETDIRKDRSFKIIYLIPGGKVNVTTDLIETFLEKPFDATVNLSYVDLYIEVHKMQRQVKESLDQKNIAAFSRNY